MSRILTSLIVLLMLSGAAWAAKKQKAAVNTKADVQAVAKLDDKPLPLFPKVETEAKAEQPLDAQAPEAEGPKTTGSVLKETVSEASTNPKTHVNAKTEAPSKTEKLKTPATEKPEQPVAAVEPAKNPPNILEIVSEAEKRQTQQNNAIQASTDLQVVDFMLTNQVLHLEPSQALEEFAEGTNEGFAFARLRSNTNTEVTFVWYRNNEEHFSFKAPVQATQQWRTFSSIKLRPGVWKVQLLDHNKAVLAEKTFSIK